MDTGAAPPVAKKTLLFKRRAAPLPSKPAGGSGGATALASNGPSLGANGLDSGVDLFRRAKDFFPRVAEEYRKEPATASAAAATTTKSVNASVVPPSKDRSEPKRRKVSQETPVKITDEDDKRADFLVEAAAVACEQRFIASAKGKGPATPNRVNSRIVFTEASGAATPLRQTHIKQSPSSQDAHDGVILLDDGDDDVILLDDGDDGDDSKIKEEAGDKKPAVMGSGGGEDDDVNEMADPEFEEYIIRARARDAAAKAAQIVQAAAVADSADPSAWSRDGSGGRGGRSDGSDNTPIKAASATSPVPLPSTATAGPPGQVYRVFVTARLPQPVPPLIAAIRMDQPMQYVQEAFLYHARHKGCELSDAEAAATVLTWKGNKIYSWTTGHLMGISDALGRFRDDVSGGGNGGGNGGGGGGIRNAGHTSKTGVAPAFWSGGLHLEFWTEALFSAFQQEQEKRRRWNLGELEDEEEEDEYGGVGGDGGADGEGNPEALAGAAGGGAAGQKTSIRVVLKSREYEKMNLTVHGDTTVAMMVAAFRNSTGLDADKQVGLFWDGDRLEEDTTVADAEIEDMDNIEVHIH